MMRAVKCIPCVMVCLGALLVLSAGSAWAALTPEEQVGKLLFFDKTLSYPDGKACADCHSPSAGFADPNRILPVSRGMNKAHVGKRNAPTAAYCGFSPGFSHENPGGYVGGQFWDGRAETLENQALVPFLNSMEMNNPNRDYVVHDVQKAPYVNLFTAVYGLDIFANGEAAYRAIARAISAYERSSEVSAFTSKFDYYLQGRTRLTPVEEFGRFVFEVKGGCSGCHPSTMNPDGSLPLFTSHRYYNLGVPANPDNPYYFTSPDVNPVGDAWIDYGLGAIMGLPETMGTMKVPTLRNVALTGPYTHNGYFATLREVVEFISTRDAGVWPPPEVSQNVNTHTGNLALTPDEIDAVVAFLGTLSDRYPVAPQGGKREPSELAAQAPSVLAMTISPNPFNPMTRIEYSIRGSAAVRVAVYDVSGRLVRVLVDGTRPAGDNATTWDGRDANGAAVASGIYFVRLDVNHDTTVRKAVLAR